MIGRVKNVDIDLSAVYGHDGVVVLKRINVSGIDWAARWGFACQGSTGRTGQHLVCPVLKGAIIKVLMPGK